MQGFYNISIKAYGMALKLASNFNEKAKLWINGRDNWEEKIASKLSKTDKVLWVHCSSLGEFEQGRPVIETLKEKYPTHKIAVSFFSPSGYEIRKNYQGADVIFYLPLDTKSNAEKLIKVLHPEILILVKYEYWFNLISTLHQHKIPTIVVSSIFRESQNFFKKDGNNWFAKKLSLINHFFVQNENSKNLLDSIQITQNTIAGDTRFDRVKQIIHQDNHLDFMETFKQHSKFIVVGSSWPKDEELFIELINQKLTNDWKIVFAPHNLNDAEINSFLSKINQKTVKFSDLEKTSQQDLIDSKVFILNTIGLLSKVYAYADITYIGGGFGAGIHNTLEAVTYGNPVVFGPKYKKFQEAVDLIAVGGGFSISNQTEFNKIMNHLMNDENFRKASGKKAGDFVQNSPNATKIIMDYLAKII
ncbi:3-deoxy-D-manno-octulosonic acid transferase [Empedobacter stercoris]|uniref:3-deoxy-D-manno-octulosonic acid transferase n=1 Tax=Empedobacter stercoris TaxID=1628248 RepID=UPI001CE17617|nr:glycosyltransferase N-terminal domain-containing protein [Empedobacter stercoris]MCA4782237.1 3-deoxy-D-manno-octulosonic acid transferase [Empedobacter stercoris]